MFASGDCPYPSPTAMGTWISITLPTMVWTNEPYYEPEFYRASPAVEELKEAARRIWWGFVGYEKRVFAKERFTSRVLEKHNWRSVEPERFRLAR